MRRKLFSVLLVVLVLPLVLNTKVSAASWINAGDRLYSNEFVNIGASTIYGINNQQAKLGLRQGQGVPWLTFLQPNYNSVYSIHNSGDGSKLEFAAYDGTNGQTHWNVFSIVRNGDIHMGHNNDPVNVRLNGTLFTKEIIVTSSGWADYVFEDDYNLKPLSEVKKFIDENKHLPNIPSAKEVESNGISVGEMQRMQIEKIEELTLYMIQMNERVNQLEQENTYLKQLLNK